MSSCDNCKTFDVYVEVGGKERYHESLRGRDEANQHPISAITNLQEALDELDNRILSSQEDLYKSIDEVTSNINRVEEQLVVAQNCLDSKIDTLGDELKLDLQEITKKINAMGDISGGQLEAIEEELDEMDKQIQTVAKDLADFTSVVETNVQNLSDLVNGRINDLSEATDKKIEQLGKDISKEIDEKIKQNSDEIHTKLDRAIVWRGSVRKFEFLPTNNQVGDMYNVEETDENYFWTGLAWDKMSGSTDHSIYATKQYVDGSIETAIKAVDQELDTDYYNRTQVDDLINAQVKFMGNLSHVSDLDIKQPILGHFFKILENNQSYIGTGTQWVEICGASHSYTTKEVDTLLEGKADKENTYTKIEVDNLLPKKVSELINDSSYLTESDLNLYIKSERVVTNSELEQYILAGEHITITKNTNAEGNITLTIGVDLAQLKNTIIETMSDVIEQVEVNTETIKELCDHAEWKSIKNVIKNSTT